MRKHHPLQPRLLMWDRVSFIHSDSEKMIVLHGGDKSERSVLIGFERNRAIVWPSHMCECKLSFSLPTAAHASPPSEPQQSLWGESGAYSNTMFSLRSLFEEFAVVLRHYFTVSCKFRFTNAARNCRRERDGHSKYACTVHTRLPHAHIYIAGRGEVALFLADGQKSARIFGPVAHGMLIEHRNFRRSVLHFLCDKSHVFLDTHTPSTTDYIRIRGDESSEKGARLQRKMLITFANLLKKNRCQVDSLQLHQDRINKRNWHHCKHWQPQRPQSTTNKTAKSANFSHSPTKHFHFSLFVFFPAAQFEINIIGQEQSTRRRSKALRRYSRSRRRTPEPNQRPDRTHRRLGDIRRGPAARWGRTQRISGQRARNGRHEPGVRAPNTGQILAATGFRAARHRPGAEIVGIGRRGNAKRHDRSRAWTQAGAHRPHRVPQQRRLHPDMADASRATHTRSDAGSAPAQGHDRRGAKGTGHRAREIGHGQAVRRRDRG